MRTLLIALPIAVLFGCADSSGTATVSAEFLENECKPGIERDLRGYAYDAKYLATERFSGILQIILQKHRADVEETDGLVIRFSIDRLIDQGVLVVNRELIERADPSKPIVLPISPLPEDANASLSLFGTCPEFPAHYGQSGRFELDLVTLAADPMDTGTGELLRGTLTATLTRANEDAPVGTLRAEFNFAPPRRPLTDFK